jgi:hypothetical protein
MHHLVQCCTIRCTMMVHPFRSWEKHNRLRLFSVEKSLDGAFLPG